MSLATGQKNIRQWALNEVAEHGFRYLHRIRHFSKTADPWVAKFYQVRPSHFDSYGGECGCHGNTTG